MTQKDPYIEFAKILQKQPYTVKLNGLDILVEKDVFPPDKSLTSEYLALEIQKIAREKSIASAIDIGTGTGYLALVMKQVGISKVVAIDNHKPAIECAKKNAKNNNLDIEIIESELFNKVPNQHFDLIVFNQPYIPYKQKIFGQGPLGGRIILQQFTTGFMKRFFYYFNNIDILISYTREFGRKNDPKRCIKDGEDVNGKYFAKYDIRTKIKDNKGTHYIYNFSITDRAI